jgi:hypothetical protein
MTAQLAPLPVAKFFDNNGAPLAFGLLTTYAAGTTTPQATYVDSTQTTQNLNPIQLNFRGECNLWLDPTKTYKLLLQDAQGNPIPGWPVDNITIGNANSSYNVIPTSDNLYTLGSPTFSWANVYVGANHAPVLDTVSGNIGYYARTAAEIAASVMPTNFSYEPYRGDVRRWTNSLVVDGTTDNTTTLTNLWATLATYKGDAYIPWNTKFTKSTVYASIPANVVLVDDSNINSPTFQPPGYRNRFQMTIEDFGGKANDSSFDNTAAFNRALTFCQANGYNILRFPGASSLWYFKTKPNPIPFGLYLEGENPRAWLVRSYTAGSSTEAFMQWTGSAGSGGDVVKGGGMRRVGLLADTGTTLGIAIDILGTTTVFRPGYMGFDDVVVTGNGQWDFGFRMNGQGITTSGSQGQRDVFIRGMLIFRCNNTYIQLSNAVHVYGFGIGCFDGGLGGTPLINITGGGSSTTNSNDIYLLGLEHEGNLTVQQCLNVHLQGRCSGTLTVDVSAANVSFIGATGGVTNGCATATIVDPATGIFTGQNITLQGNTAVMGFSGNVAASATAGGGSALPATPTGYIICTVGGNSKKIPYYNT